MAKVLAHGTVLVKEQREVDRVLAASQDALDQAEAANEDIEFFAWTVIIDEATRHGDDQTLERLDQALTDLHRTLAVGGVPLQEMADDLDRKAQATKKEIDEKVKEVLTGIAPESAGRGAAAPVPTTPSSGSSAVSAPARATMPRPRTGCGIGRAR